MDMSFYVDSVDNLSRVRNGNFYSKYSNTNERFYDTIQKKILRTCFDVGIGYSCDRIKHINISVSGCGEIKHGGHIQLRKVIINEGIGKEEVLLLEQNPSGGHLARFCLLTVTIIPKSATQLC